MQRMLRKYAPALSRRASTKNFCEDDVHIRVRENLDEFDERF